MAEPTDKSRQKSNKASPAPPRASKGQIAPPAKPGKAAKPVAANPGKVSLASVIAERDRLKIELAAAQARILELEKARQDAINRIDWVIDSLQGLKKSRA